MNITHAKLETNKMKSIKS